MDEKNISKEEFYQNVNMIMDADRLTVLVDKCNRLSSNYIPVDLEKISPGFNPLGLLLRREARRAFEIMCFSASGKGIHLEAVSAFRSFVYQETVYMNHWTPDITLEEYQSRRDRVSARPGHSEHQTGLAVDINELEQTFETTRAGTWLAFNSYQYGFILRYPKGKEYITGYDYEPWHYRYIGRALARKVYTSGLTYDEYYKLYLTSKDALPG